MKEEVIELDTVDKYNKFFKVETYHPMVTVVDLSKITQPAQPFTINYGIYVLVSEDTLCGDITYGRQPYDYQEGPLSVCTGTGGFHPRTGRNASHRIRTALPSGLDSWYPTGTRYPELFFLLLRRPAKPCTSRKKNGTR